MARRYARDDVEIVTFRCIEPNSERYLSIKNWILSMTVAQDDEIGNEFWQYIRNNHALAKNDSSNLLNTFFVFARNNPTQVLATRSIVSDDQNMNKVLGLKEAFWFAGFNVHRDFRARGLGTILFEYTDNHIRQVINREIIVRMFTTNPASKHLYSKFGFESQGFVYVDAVGKQPVRSTF
jgi:GNAT superfamily N-acetyltransferase